MLMFNTTDFGPKLWEIIFLGNKTKFQDFNILMKYIFVFLLQDEIENMVREGEKHAAADQEKKERIEAVNQAEGVLHDTESKVEEFKDQLPSEDVEKIKTQITEVRGKLADKDNMTGEEIKKTVDELQKSSLKLFEMAYKVN